MPIKAVKATDFFVPLDLLLVHELSDRVKFVIVFLLAAVQSVQRLAFCVICHVNGNPTNMACSVDWTPCRFDCESHLEPIYSSVELVSCKDGLVVDPGVDVCVCSATPVKKLQGSEK